MSQNVLLFDLPLMVRFSGRFGSTNCPLPVAAKEEDFYFPLPSAPQVVRLDPEYTVLARTTFSLPVPMLTAQLADQSDMMGRLLAIGQLSAKATKETVAQLKQVLNNDPFYGVRIEAALALRSVHIDEALDALLASTNQPDARVRLQVMNAIGGFYQEKAYAAGIRALDQEKNPDILSAEIRGLAGYSKPEVRTVLEKYLGSESFRNELAVAAVRALRQQDDPAAISPLLETLKRREREFTSRGFAEGLGALAFLGRNEEKKQAAREYLVSYVTSPKSPVRLASLSALGTLGDSAAIPVLEKYATASKETPERTTAERALTQLRAGRRPADEFNTLREEVLELQKTNRQLRKDLDALQKKFEAAAPGPASSGKRNKKPAVAARKHG